MSLVLPYGLSYRPFVLLPSNFLLLPSDVLSLVVIEQIEAGPAEMNVVLGDLVPEQAPGPRVFADRDDETACKIAQPRSDDQDDVVLAFPPRNAADFVVRNERRLRPDAVLVEPARDAPAHRKQI